MRDALDAIGQLNQELLAMLVLAARRDSVQPFPLADSLRDRFVYLTAAEIRAISHCGVLLADAEFTVAARWRNADGAGDSAMDLDLRGHWLTRDQAIAFGFAVLMLAWHVIHAAPGIAGVLLGMSAAVLTDFQRLGINDLVVIAQKPLRWIKPRWIDSPEVWTGIIDLATDPISKESSKMTLHCLKLSAAYSPRLMASVSSRWP